MRALRAKTDEDEDDIPMAKSRRRRRRRRRQRIARTTTVASDDMETVKNFVFRSFTGPPHSHDDEDYLNYSPHFSPKSALSDYYDDDDEVEENFGFRSAKLGKVPGHAEWMTKSLQEGDDSNNSTDKEDYSGVDIDYEDGGARTGSMGKGTIGQGSMGNGSMNQGSNGKGSMGQGHVP